MMVKTVQLREVGPREGFQILKPVIPTENKLKLISALNKTGLKSIEVTSLVRPEMVPQMADADSLISQFERVPNVRYSALYLNPKGFVRGEELKRLDNEGWLFTATSDTFLKKNNNTTFEDILDSVPKWLATFGSHGKKLHGLMLSTAFGCNYEGSIPDEKIYEAVKKMDDAARKSGQEIKEVCLADTIGSGDPEQVRKLVNLVRERCAIPTVSLHLHDTRGLGIANVYAGLLEGVSIFDCSIGGLGGCPFVSGASGNVATEEVVNLCESLGIETGVDLKQCIEAVRVAEQVTGLNLNSRLFRMLKGS